MKTRSQKLLQKSSVATKPKLKKMETQSKKSIDQSKERSVVTFPQQLSTKTRSVEKMMTRSMIKTVPANLTKHNATKTKSNNLKMNATKISSNKKMVNGVKEVQNEIAEHDYKVYTVGDLVWAKMKGWPNWTAKVRIFV